MIVSFYFCFILKNADFVFYPSLQDEKFVIMDFL